ncbi:hypothetical protein H5T58_00170, partial [Candidatus Parcubacteria bacterium]|nr:hypothetical protein [Candidatus Parcubacteria bacterium]
MKKSAISVYTLVFGLILILLLGGLLNFLLSEIKITNQKIAREQAFNIAETGIFYYLWCQNNQVSCPLQKDYEDFSGKIIGKFQLEVEREMNCGIEGTHKVTSIGWTLKYPQIKRKISVIFGRESIAKFSFLLNSDVWVGQDVIIFGPYHSNGGVRFDGKNLSLVSSSKEKWVCTKNFGCGPEGQGYGLGLCPPECQIIEKQCICPGVFSTTKNSNRDLFSFPVPNFDFLGLTLDLAEMKQKAQNYGIYLPPSHNINSNGKGWHLIFREDGTLEARIITQLNCISSYSLEEGAHIDCFTISKEISYRTFQIPADCGLIFVEDNIWPEGKIKGKVTLA